MGTREDFEKAFIERFGTRYFAGEGAEEALWAVKWAMERCLELHGKTVVYKDDIRQLAKEME